MDNHLIMDKVAMFLSHSELKTARFVNKFWNNIMRRELRMRKSTTIILSPLTVTALLEYEEIFCSSVRLEYQFRGSFTTLAKDTFDKFFLKFGKHVKNLQWSCVSLMDNYTGYLLMRQSCCNVIYLGQFLFSLPNLEELSLRSIGGPNCFDRYRVSRPVTTGLFWMRLPDWKNLSTINFGHNSRLSEKDVDEMIGHNFQIRQFTFIGREIGWRSGEPMSTLLNSWRSTLEYLRIRSSPAFKLLPMLVLKTFLIESTFGLIEPLPIVEQFPALQKLSQNFEPNFDWNEFVPDEMSPHLKLKVLDISEGTYKKFETPNFIRLLKKCPNLRILSTGKVNDEVGGVIFEHLHGLESLTMHASFSHETFMGLENEDFYKATTENSQQEFEALPTKQLSSIQNLPNLRELTITGSDGMGIISDFSVLYGISKLGKLRKLTLPDGISDRSLELFALFPELTELNLQAPKAIRKLTSGGIDRLKLAKPSLVINVANIKNYNKH